MNIFDIDDLLQSEVDELTLKDLEKFVETLDNQLEKTQKEIDDLLETNKDEIDPLINKGEQCQMQIDYLTSQIDQVKNELKDKDALNIDSIELHKKSIEKIANYNEAIEMLEKLQQFESNLTDFSKAIDTKDYQKCDEYLNKLNNFHELSKAIEHDSHQIKIVRRLKEEFTVQRERLYHESEQQWDQHVIIVTKDDQIDFSIDSEVLAKLLNQTSSLFKQNFLFKRKLSVFCETALSILKQIILSEARIRVENLKKGLRIRFERNIMVTSNDTDAKLEPIKQILKYLSENLFHIKSYNETLMSQLRQLLVTNHFFEHLFNLIYSDLFVSSINLSQFDDKEVQSMCESLKRLEAFLFDINLIDSNFLETNTSANLLFKQFQANTKSLYVKRKCSHVLNECKSLMKNEDLFTKKLQRISEPISINSHELKDILKGSKIKFDRKNYMLLFSECTVSSMTIKVMQKVYEVLEEAARFHADNELKTNEQNVALLCLSAKNILDLHSSVVPMFYKATLIRNSQSCAIAFNDFMFIANQCLTLTHQFKEALKASSITFIEFVPRFRLIAYRIINDKINAVRSLLIENNNAMKGLMSIAETDNYEMYKRPLVDSLEKLSELSSQWKDFLPKGIYDEIFGEFFNQLCSSLVDAVLSLEDISSDDAHYLTLLLEITRQSIVFIFTGKGTGSLDEFLKSLSQEDLEKSMKDSKNGSDEIDVVKNVANWMKFKYLMVILDAHLVDIDNLWSESKGPLALYYTSDEVRKLIKALFMMTEKRTEVLKKIY